jgi:hypothetical protein
MNGLVATLLLPTQAGATSERIQRAGQLLLVEAVA